MAKAIYSAFFLENGLHCTWEFAPGKCKLPVPEGTEVKLFVVGKYQDNDVACDIVEVELPNGERLTHQGSGTVLHVTTFCQEGVSPVQSGLRATKNGWTKLSEKRVVTAKAGFFRV